MPLVWAGDGLDLVLSSTIYIAETICSLHYSITGLNWLHSR